MANERDENVRTGALQQKRISANRPISFFADYGTEPPGLYSVPAQVASQPAVPYVPAVAYGHNRFDE